MERVCKLKIFENYVQSLTSSTYSDWMSRFETQSEVYLTCQKEYNEIVYSKLRLIIMSFLFKPEILIEKCWDYVECALDSDRNELRQHTCNLEDIILTQVTNNSPLLLFSASGYDVTRQIDMIASTRNIEINSVAMGSNESVLQADSIINNCIKYGKWVVIKNVHLAISWIKQLEKKINFVQKNDNFRLILTTSMESILPINVLLFSRILVFEQTIGICGNVMSNLSLAINRKTQMLPVETWRLYFIVTWAHSLFMERNRYCPIGWSQKYTFYQSDLTYAFDVVDSWMSSLCHGRDNIDPNKI
ncbi:hypothetical protein A3Q56_08653, partial [Intoshia linei]